MANTESKKLAVDVIARIDKLEKAMAKAANVTNSGMAKVERRTKSAASAVDNSFGRMGQSALKLGAAFASAAAIKGAQVLIDTATRIDNALKVAGLSGQQLTAVYDALYASAQRNAAPLESLVQLYGRASLVQKELGVSTQDLLRFTDNVALALRVSGKSAQESSGALLQLSQALGSGVVRSQEFNSMLEGALPIVQAAARGIEEAGGSVAKLRQLVNDGKVSSTAFFKGFQAGADVLKQQVAGSTFTVAQGFERLQNAAIDAAKRINDTTGASRSAISVLDGLVIVVNKLAEAFEGLAKARGLKETADRMDDLGAAARNLLNDPSFRNLYEFLFDTSGSKAKSAANDAIDARARALEELRKAMSAVNTEAAKASGGKPNRFDEAFGAFGGKTISLKDNPVTGTKDGTDLDAFQRRLAMTQRQIDLMGVEARTIDQTAAARERARIVVELETAAREANRRAGLANTEVTAAQRTQIEALADSYAKAAAQLEQLNGPLRTFAREAADTDRQVQDLAVNGLQTFENSLVDVVSGTKSAQEAFKEMTASILNDIARMVLRMTVVAPLAKALGGVFSGGVGAPLNILPPGYADGGYTGPGGKYQPAGVVHKGEYVFDAEATRRIGVRNLEKLRNSFAEGGYVGSSPRIPNMRGASGGAPISVSVPISIDARGADRDGLSRVEAQVIRLHAELPARIVNTVRDARSRGAL